MSIHWALLERFDIRDEGTGELYLRRWRIVQTPWFGLYLHKIASRDKDRDPHDHPWSFVSLVLRGGYDEYRPGIGIMARGWLSLAFRRANDAHTILRLHRTPTWTLVAVGRRKRIWGFHTRTGWVDWRRYLGLPGEAKP